MRWLALTLAGPMIWAAAFTLVYGMHGVLCAGVAGPEGLSLTARLVLIASWALGLAAFVPLFMALREGDALTDRLPRYGTWIGLVATIYTLFPTAIATSC
ncbi:MULTISPECIES: hypothetical protein [unclassified Yoonia]|uniref:hypothetical protein n=1 Tax=unclassified Yoonia TaxID=2629118 RepID=UPI002AFE9B04|nr:MULTISPECIES: hypothetical protein [unclassified Yoonia]